MRGGQVVVERTFADVLGVRAGDSITLDGRSFTVAGIAVTAVLPSYPNVSLAMNGARSLIPARIGARRPVAEILQSELA